MYGPTFPEHLYTVAAQSYGVVDNKSTTNVEGNYCDDNTEYTQRFPIEDLTDAEIKRMYVVPDARSRGHARRLLTAYRYIQTEPAVDPAPLAEGAAGLAPGP